MIGFRIDGQYLELGERAATEIERNSPFILGDEILGEYSMPVTAPATERNVRLLGFITELGTIRSGAKVRREADYVEFGLFMYRGTLVAEFVNIDLNNPDRGVISLYFLTAISSFYSRAKGVCLHQLDLGGVRTINNFQAHAVASWMNNSDGFDYAFMPVHNTRYIPMGDDPEEKIARMMNPIRYNAGVVELDPIAGSNKVMPFPYYVYLLRRIFAQFGYTLSGSILEDAGFKKACALTFNSIWWTERKPGDAFPTVKDVVQFDLANHVPRDYPVTKLLINLGNLLAIGYRIDNGRNHCELVKLNTVLEQGTRKDMTGKVDSRVKISTEREAKIYALKLNFDSADARASKPDFSGMTFLGNFETVDDLPAAHNGIDNHYALLTFGNWFYACKYDEDLGAYMWNYMADNIYDYEPAGNNQSIESAVTPVGQSYVVWREQPAGTLHRALMPHVQQEGNWGGKFGGFVNWELRILFNHGMAPDGSGVPVPFASSHNYTHTGLKVADYSLAFNAATDNLVEAFWRRWLTILQAMEVGEFMLRMNRAEFLQLSWADIILIRNIPFLITGQTVASPFNEKVPCKALRIDYSPPPFVCQASIQPGSITVQNNNNGSVTVDFTPGEVPGTKWSYLLTDQGTGETYASGTTNAHPFNITGLPDFGEYKLVLKAQCGDSPGQGEEVKYFAIGVAPKVTLHAVELRSGGVRKFRVTAKPVGGGTFGNSFSFRFGQCTEFSGVLTCGGFPSAPANQNAFATINAFEGQFQASAYTGASHQAGATLEKIVIHGMIGILPAQITKDAGQEWELQFE